MDLLSGLAENISRFFNTFFNWNIIVSTMPDLLMTGLPNTLFLAVSGGAISIVLGIVIAFGLMSRTRWLRWPCRVYVDVFRGLPQILTIYLIGVGIPLVGWKIFGNNALGYAALAVGFMEAAYMAEIFRSGFQSVEKGLVEAGRSLGLSHGKTLRFIVMPIGYRRILPALTGQFILIIKATALVYLIGLTIGQRELFAVAQNASNFLASLSPLTAAGIVYLLLTVPLTYVVNLWDKKMREGRPAQFMDEPDEDAVEPVSVPAVIGAGAGESAYPPVEATTRARKERRP
jgi:His/Glu/Gln/Arg/opine family amino acid ABC transporter permease subunit